MTGTPIEELTGAGSTVQNFEIVHGRQKLKDTEALNESVSGESVTADQNLETLPLRHG